MTPTANPAFFTDDSPYLLPAMSALAVEVWTTNGGLRMDNFVVGHDAAAALAYAEESWKRESVSGSVRPHLTFSQQTNNTCTHTYTHDT